MSPEPTPQPDSKPESAPTPNIRPLAAEIAAELGETLPAPLYQIDRIIEHCGEDFAREVLAAAREIEAGGGMTVEDGSRKRTFGGVFFYLARGRMTQDQKWLVFWKPQREAKERRRQRRKQTPPFPWDRRLKLLEALLKKPGRATGVKVRFAGKAGRITRRDGYVVCEIEQTLKPKGYPHGVPAPPQTPSTYTVYVGAKQWQRVAGAIKANRADKLVVEGQCAFVPALAGMAVFAMFVSTAALERAKREQQRAEGG